MQLVPPERAGPVRIDSVEACRSGAYDAPNMIRLTFPLRHCSTDGVTLIDDGFGPSLIRISANVFGTTGSGEGHGVLLTDPRLVFADGRTVDSDDDIVRVNLGSISGMAQGAARANDSDFCSRVESKLLGEVLALCYGHICWRIQVTFGGCRAGRPTLEHD